MDFRILDPFEVVDRNRPVVLPRGRGRMLLALLVLQAGEVVSTECLIDWLWGEAPPSTARTALHGHVSSLRERPEPAQVSIEASAILTTRPPGYVLAIDRYGRKGNLASVARPRPLEQRGFAVAGR